MKAVNLTSHRTNVKKTSSENERADSDRRLCVFLIHFLKSADIYAFTILLKYFCLLLDVSNIPKLEFLKCIYSVFHEMS